jgi:hypothetical protein
MVKMKKETISNELQKLYLALNEPKPDKFDEMITFWEECLKEIPEELIHDSFISAAKESRRMKMPNPASVIQAFRDMPKKQDFGANIPQQEGRYEWKDGRNDLPTREQHEKAIQVVLAVLNKKIDSNTGKPITPEDGEKYIKQIMELV